MSKTKNKFIICTPREIRSLLDDRKTQLRKPVKQDLRVSPLELNTHKLFLPHELPEEFKPGAIEYLTKNLSPYQVGDRIIVKETWREAMSETQSPTCPFRGRVVRQLLVQMMSIVNVSLNHCLRHFASSFVAIRFCP